MSSPRQTFLDPADLRLFGETNSADTLAAFVPIFTDPYAVMYQNEIKASLRERYCREIWEFLDTVSRLDSVYNKVRTLMTNDDMEGAAQQYAIMLTWTNKIIDKFLKPNAEKYLNIGDTENKALYIALGELPKTLDDIEPHFTQMENAFKAPVKEALNLIRINIDVVHRERLVKAESLILAAKEILGKIESIRLVMKAINKQEIETSKANFFNNATQDTSTEEKSKTPTEVSRPRFSSRYVTHSYPQLNNSLLTIQNDIEKILFEPSIKLEKFDEAFLALIENAPTTELKTLASTIEKSETHTIKVSTRIIELAELFPIIRERLQKFYNIDDEFDFTNNNTLRTRSLTIETPSSKGPGHFQFIQNTPKNNAPEPKDTKAPPNTPKGSK